MNYFSGTGTLYCFGDGQYGQLGVSVRHDSPYLSTPSAVPIPSPDKIINFDAGMSHSAAVTGKYPYPFQYWYVTQRCCDRYSKCSNRQIGLKIQKQNLHL